MGEPLTSRARARSRLSRLLARAALSAAVLAAAVAPALLSRAPAHAAVSQPLTQEYDQEVFGNFGILGNAVLQCPADNAACAASAARTSTAGPNDNFAMRYADVDSDPATFDSSSGKLTIPPGARIDFARLYWAGNTGLATAGDGTTRKPSCLGVLSAPTTLPPGSPQAQPVTLAFGDAPATNVTGKVFVEDAPPAGQAQYYSGEADVKALLAAQPTGTPLTVTVGNVWAPAGPGCFGGWSLIYVYKYDGADPTYAPHKREVFVHAGHIKEGSTDPAINLTITGFTALSSVPPRVGMTAYEGDWPIKGDTFAINDTVVPEPATKATDNFFISAADGQDQPNTLNNFSVDAKSFTPPLGAIAAGSTSVKLTFATSGDRYLVQNLAFSVTIPELRISKTADPAVAKPGQTVTFTITVSNPTDADAADVVVRDPVTPACGKTIGALAAGASTTYTCTATVSANQGTTAFRNSASVSGTVADTPVTSTVDTDVPIPSIAVSVTPDPAQARPGDQVTFTVKVTNNGGADLTGVAVSDSVIPGCGKTVGALAAGASTTYTCTGTATRDKPGASTYTNPVTASGVPVVPAGSTPVGPVSDSASAVVAVGEPSISVSKTVAPTQVRPGDPVTITVTVTNTGDLPLSNVAVTDKDFPACSKSDLGTLQPGASTKYDCTVTAPGDDVTTTSTATGQPSWGGPVSATSKPATIDVVHPAIQLVKIPVPAHPNPGDPLAYIITVTNTGDVPLSGIKVNDPAAPGCSRTVGTLAPGASETCGCMITTPNVPFSNTATATGTPPFGPDVSDSSTVKIDVTVPAAHQRS
jgi:uncharacterized repeat protein (TIGR01451 family)